MAAGIARPQRTSVLQTLIEASMCSSIRTLFNFESPVTAGEIRTASLQFVRKLSGFNAPSRRNQEAFDRAVNEMAAAADTLSARLITSAGPRDREMKAARARVRAATRYAAPK